MLTALGGGGIERVGGVGDRGGGRGEGGGRGLGGEDVQIQEGRGEWGSGGGVGGEIGRRTEEDAANWNL